jgi:hypothetical protein
LASSSLKFGMTHDEKVSVTSENRGYRVDRGGHGHRAHRHNQNHYRYYSHYCYNYGNHRGENRVPRVGPGSSHYNRQDGLHEEQMVQKLDVHRSHKWSHNVQYYESGEQKIARHGEQHGN